MFFFSPAACLFFSCFPKMLLSDFFYSAFSFSMPCSGLRLLDSGGIVCVYRCVVYEYISRTFLRQQARENLNPDHTHKHTQELT